MPGGQLLLWDPFVRAPDRPDLTQLGPLVPCRSQPRDMSWRRPLARSLTLRRCDCCPPSHLLFSLLEKSGSVHSGSDATGHIYCCCPARRHGWMLPQSQAVYLTYLLIDTAFMSIDPAVLGQPSFPQPSVSCLQQQPQWCPAMTMTNL